MDAHVCDLKCLYVDKVNRLLSAAILKSDSEKLMGYTSHVDLSSQPPNYPNLLMHNETFTDSGEPNSGHV